MNSNISMSSNESNFLFSIDNIYEGEFICRPSLINKSPYVGDVLYNQESKIIHLPSMDMGGKCFKGAKLLMSKSKNAGKKSKYGTPSCDFICQAVKVNELENNNNEIICGAHPSHGERIVSELFRPNSIYEPLSNSKIISCKPQACNVANCDMRSDFLVELEDGTFKLVEVKTIVDTDYNKKFCKEYENNSKVIYYNDEQVDEEYIRHGIFPWGRGKQKGPEGEKVVSSRAIKHVMEMTEIAKGNKKDERYEKLSPVVIFVVVRNDVDKFKPNVKSCPSFAKYLKIAYQEGVQLIALKSEFTYDSDLQKINVNYVSTLDIVF